MAATRYDGSVLKFDAYTEGGEVTFVCNPPSWLRVGDFIQEDNWEYVVKEIGNGHVIARAVDRFTLRPVEGK